MITDTTISPLEGQDDDEAEVTISGKGLFDTPFKEISAELKFASGGNDY